MMWESKARLRIRRMGVFYDEMGGQGVVQLFSGMLSVTPGKRTEEGFFFLADNRL